jgi:hypothetical protein
MIGNFSVKKVSSAKYPCITIFGPHKICYILVCGQEDEILSSTMGRDNLTKHHRVRLGEEQRCKTLGPLLYLCYLILLTNVSVFPAIRSFIFLSSNHARFHDSKTMTTCKLLESSVFVLEANKCTCISLLQPFSPVKGCDSSWFPSTVIHQNHTALKKQDMHFSST